MLVFKLLLGLTAMFALLGVAGWLWLADPAWPLVDRVIHTGPPAPEVPPATPPVLPSLPPSARAESEVDHTRIEAVVFREREPDPEPNATSDRTQILSDQVMSEQLLRQPAHPANKTLVLVDNDRDDHAERSRQSS